MRPTPLSQTPCPTPGCGTSFDTVGGTVWECRAGHRWAVEDVSLAASRLMADRTVPIAAGRNGRRELTVAAERAPSTWPAPNAVIGLPSAPSLDLKLLPREIANVTLDAARRLQCPADYVAWSLIGTMAGLIGRGCGLRPRQRDTWTERAAVWLVLIGPPSWMKTPAFAEGLRPLRRQAALDRERHQANLDTWADTCDLIRAGLKRGAKAKLPPAPIEGRRETSDATVEKLAVLMADSPGLTLFRDEIGGWVGAFNRYAKADGDRQFYLEAYSGGSFTVDRMTRETVVVSDLYLGVIGGAQPDRAREIFGEGADDGFASRFTAIYPNEPAPFEDVDAWPDKIARDELDAVADALVAARWSTLLDRDEWRPLPFCRLDPDAGALWSAWHTALMRRLRDGEWEGRQAGRIGKYPGLVARLALVWHLVAWGAGRVDDAAVRRVSAATVEQVLALASSYLIPMDERVYRAFDRSTSASGGERIARWIVDTKPSSFTLREIRRRAWSGLTEPGAVESGVEWLAAQGWVREADPEQRPGRPANRYDVNPLVFAMSAR